MRIFVFAVDAVPARLFLTKALILFLRYEYLRQAALAPLGDDGLYTSDKRDLPPR